jgi:uncharacterized membrane protein YGL010W
MKKEKKIKVPPSENAQIQNLAIRMFLMVGLGFTLVLVGFMFMFIGIVMYNTRSIVLEDFRAQAPYWFFSGIICLLVGSYMLHKELRENPTISDNLRQEIGKSKQDRLV